MRSGRVCRFARPATHVAPSLSTLCSSLTLAQTRQQLCSARGGHELGRARRGVRRGYLPPANRAGSATLSKSRPMATRRRQRGLAAATSSLTASVCATRRICRSPSTASPCASRAASAAHSRDARDPASRASWLRCSASLNRRPVASTSTASTSPRSSSRRSAASSSSSRKAREHSQPALTCQTPSSRAARSDRR